jgi:uncharacterized OsmC-like protein
MSETVVRLAGAGRCEARSDDTGAVVETASPAQLGGPGGGFSSTDLVAAALGTCVATSVQVVAGREGIADERVTVRVHKVLADKPRVIRQLTVVIEVVGEITAAQRRKILAVAKTCPVHRSLAAQVVFSLRVDGRLHDSDFDPRVPYFLDEEGSVHDLVGRNVEPDSGSD